MSIDSIFYIYLLTTVSKNIIIERVYAIHIGGYLLMKIQIFSLSLCFILSCKRSFCQKADQALCALSVWVDLISAVPLSMVR